MSTCAKCDTLLDIKIGTQTSKKKHKRPSFWSWMVVPYRMLRVWHAIKPGSTHHFFINALYQIRKMTIVTLYCSSFLCVLHFGVVSLLCRSSLIFDTFPSVLVFNPDLFFLYRFMNFEQRYTTIAFIKHVCYHSTLP